MGRMLNEKYIEIGAAKTIIGSLTSYICRTSKYDGDHVNFDHMVVLKWHAYSMPLQIH